MIHMGVDNILTNAPAVLVELLNERRKIDDAEKTLLFVTDFLAGRLSRRATSLARTCLHHGAAEAALQRLVQQGAVDLGMAAAD